MINKSLFLKLKKDPNFIHYVWAEKEVYPFDDKLKMYRDWFYNPKTDRFFKFNKLKDFAEDTLLSTVEGMDEPMHFFEYKDKSFQFIDTPPCYERFLMLAVIERLKVLGFNNIKFIEKNKKRSYRIKFSNKEDYAFFKLKFHEYILP